MITVDTIQTLLFWHLFIWFCCDMHTLGCIIWDLVPWAAMEPRLPCIGCSESQPLDHNGSSRFEYYNQFHSVSEMCQTPWDPVDCSTPGLSVYHQLPELAQTHFGDAIQPSHPLSSPSPTFNLSQHQGLFQWVSSSHQVAKGLEFQLQHQSFQWIFRTDFL